MFLSGGIHAIYSHRCTLCRLNSTAGSEGLNAMSFIKLIGQTKWILTICKLTAEMYYRLEIIWVLCRKKQISENLHVDSRQSEVVSVDNKWRKCFAALVFTICKTPQLCRSINFDNLSIKMNCSLLSIKTSPSFAWPSKN